MSISRRQFILGTAAGLILPSYYDKIFSYFENTGEALLEIPKQSSRTLYAATWGDGFEFLLDGRETEAPIGMTRREYARRYFGGEQEYIDAYDLDPDYVDFDEPEYQDMVDTAWTRNDSPSAKSHRYLHGLDLGPNFGGDDAVGQIDFLDYPNPCSNYLGVQTEDPVSVSLLQKRLNDLNTGIRVSVVDVS
jgi:hypothetical protein